MNPKKTIKLSNNLEGVPGILKNPRNKPINKNLQ